MQLAKAMTAIDCSPAAGSSSRSGPVRRSRDYEIAGVDFDERWKRLDEAVQAMRALWRRDGEPFVGRFYSTEGIELLPGPGADRRAADLDRQLGVGRRPASHRPTG